MGAIRGLTLACLAFVLAVPAAAQRGEATVGLGVGLQATTLSFDDSAILGFLSPQLYLPVSVSNRLLVEPSFGLFRLSQEQEDFQGNPVTLSISMIRLGTGVLYTWEMGDAGRAYAGPRVGLIRTSEEQEGSGFDDSSTRTDLLLAAVAGGEFFLAEDLSLGGELGLEWIRWGEEEPDPTEVEMSVLRTLTEIRIRWYPF